MLGAAGAVEAIATIEAIRHSYVPKTAGTKELSDYIEANVVYGEVKKLILSTQFQILSVLVDTMLSLPLNVGRLNS